MAATPLLLVTAAGLAAASTATPTGPFIHITQFSIGDAYGYQPQSTDVGLNGHTLYTGTPLSYTNVGNNTLDILCQIPPEAGPFDFGELAIWNVDGNNNLNLFAKAVWDFPQTKYSSLGSNVASSFTLHCLLKLEQSISVLQVDTINPVAVVEVDLWSDVTPPSVGVSQGVPLTLVKELDGFNCSSLLHVSNANKWTVGTNYEPYKNSTIVNGATTWVEVAQSDFLAADLTSTNRFYVIEFQNEEVFRSVLSFAVSGSNYRFTLNPNPLENTPSNGDVIRVYKSVNYPTLIPPATSSVQGIVQAGKGLNVPTPGTFETYGLLHGVNGIVATLDSSTDLNNAYNGNATPSGLYSVAATSTPLNFPVSSVACTVMIINMPSGMSQQTVYQTNSTNVWTRSINNPTTGTWSSWVQLNQNAGNGLALTGNQYNTYGLLHGVPGTGRQLTGSDDLNNLSLPSGAYAAYQGQMPANSPVNWPGHFYIVNQLSTITQTYYPGGNTANPIYFRSYYPSVGWSGWQTFVINGRNNPSIPSGQRNIQGYAATTDFYGDRGPTSGVVINVTCSSPYVVRGIQTQVANNQDGDTVIAAIWLHAAITYISI